MHRLLLVIAMSALAGVVAACGDNLPGPHQDPPMTIDAGPDQPANVACLDQPTEMARAPSNQLPCELLPPGFGQ